MLVQSISTSLLEPATSRRRHASRLPLGDVAAEFASGRALDGRVVPLHPVDGRVGQRVDAVASSQTLQAADCYQSQYDAVSLRARRSRRLLAAARRPRIVSGHVVANLVPVLVRIDDGETRFPRSARRVLSREQNARPTRRLSPDAQSAGDFRCAPRVDTWHGDL